MSEQIALAEYGVRELANWILDYADDRGEQISNLSLNKLVYFAYEYALLKRGRKLTKAKIEAWDHGPVFREIYHSFKHFGNGPINSRAEQYNPKTNQNELVLPRISIEDQDLIREAITDLLNVPAYILREISHVKGGAWDKTWHYEGNANPGMHITDEVIIDSARKTSNEQPASSDQKT